MIVIEALFNIVKALFSLAVMIGIGIFFAYLSDMLNGRTERRSRHPRGSVATRQCRPPPDPEPPVIHPPENKPYPWRPWS